MAGSQSNSEADLIARCERATNLIKEGKEDEALAAFQELLQLTNNSFIRSGILNGVGQICSGRGHLDEAIAFFKEANHLNPESADAMANLGLCHKWRGNLDQAERWVKRALKKNPWHNAAQFTQSLIALLGGDYLRGFDLYECRFRSRIGGLRKIETNHPDWDGANGQNLYVYGEQGAGDIILMLRYARLIHALGIKQTWALTAALAPLARLMPEIDSVLVVGDPLPSFDCHAPAASLPRIFQTTLETVPSAPYIPKPDGVDYGPGFHVGIVWRGNKTQPNDTIRSTNLEHWLPVLNVPGVTFHSLQVDGADEALLYPQLVMHDKPTDWLDTAKRVAGLDLVISVDTSMVHLCGALGVKCWCALHCRPYFVFPIVREDCPWYPSVKLFKQRKEFEWAPVFQQIAKELYEQTSHHHAR